MWISPPTDFSVCEMDELYHFIGSKKGYENGINSYVMTQTTDFPRQIVNLDVDNAKTTEHFQRLVDDSPAFKSYCTDGCRAYQGVNFPGFHIRNIHDKSDTCGVESVNSDLRHYIAGLHRRCKTFFRKKETKHAVLFVFACAYNKFGDKKACTRVPVIHKSPTPNKKLHKWQYPNFSILDFL